MAKGASLGVGKLQKLPRSRHKAWISELFKRLEGDMMGYALVFDWIWRVDIVLVAVLRDVDAEADNETT